MSGRCRRLPVLVCVPNSCTSANRARCTDLISKSWTRGVDARFRLGRSPAEAETGAAGFRVGGCKGRYILAIFGSRAAANAAASAFTPGRQRHGNHTGYRARRCALWVWRALRGARWLAASKADAAAGTTTLRLIGDGFAVWGLFML